MTGGDWLQAQYSVLGSALLWPELVPKILLETTAEDFSGPCKTVYEAVRTLHTAGETVDPISVNHALNNRYGDFLRELMEIVPSSADIDRHIRICREQARSSNVRQLAHRMALAESMEQMRKVLEEINGLMVDRPGLRIVGMEEALKSFYQRKTQTVQYLAWPLQDLNDRLYASRDDFIVIGGYPSTGKSAWALQCARFFAQRQKVGFFSLETSPEKLFDRSMASLPELTMDSIKRNDINGAGWDAVARNSEEILKTDLDLIPAAGMTATDIRAVTAMKGYQIIFIDYLQLLQGSGANRAEQVAGISMALHTMAQSMGVTVIALSQLKRKGDSESPSMSDLRESGQIEQDADIVMILQLEQENEPSGPRGLYIAKNKEGTTFKIKLDFDGKHQVFSKANRTGETISQIKAIAKKEKQRQRQEKRENGQMSMLPNDTYVPF